jgi:hypothetical protein
MRHFILIAGLAALASCTESTNTAEAPPAASPAAAAGPMSAADAGVQKAGPPVDCIQIRAIGESRVIDNQTIDFHMGPGTPVYRNRLPYSCPQLGFERRFGFSTSLSQLCSTDTIWVIIGGGGIQRGATCGLGQFQPVTGAPR